ncbi:MAG: hypothetical protein A2224_03700 [Candidatus Magasanikbacteria bacterium RIFOXYA2_FULL_40_20]|nr:MAG: hypothetical protein A2224_03700 [Candidatus Magasanikbacteria bacterium RIFOXYA2_FULL_40_20]
MLFLSFGFPLDINLRNHYLNQYFHYSRKIWMMRLSEPWIGRLLNVFYYIQPMKLMKIYSFKITYESYEKTYTLDKKSLL